MGVSAVKRHHSAERHTALGYQQHHFLPSLHSSSIFSSRNKEVFLFDKLSVNPRSYSPLSAGKFLPLCQMEMHAFLTLSLPFSELSISLPPQIYLLICLLHSSPSLFTFIPLCLISPQFHSSSKHGVFSATLAPDGWENNRPPKRKH